LRFRYYSGSILIWQEAEEDKDEKKKMEEELNYH
jgi:hypothetical protein